MVQKILGARTDDRPGRTRPDWTGPDQTRPDRTGSDQTGPHCRTILDRTRPLTRSDRTDRTRSD